MKTESADNHGSGLAAVQSNIRVLQEFMTIIMGIALANLVFQFVIRSVVDIELGKLRDFNPRAGGMFLAMTVLSIRFFHGNMRALDDVYMTSDSADSVHRWMELTDFFVLIGQGLIFCAIGFLLETLDGIFWCLVIMFSLDVVFGLVPIFFGSTRILERGRRTWFFLGLVSLVALGVIKLFGLYLFWALVGISGFTTVLDYLINAEIYFPVPSAGSKSGAGM